MVWLREKRTPRGVLAGYLVQSVREGKKVRQEIVLYLGRKTEPERENHLFGGMVTYNPTYESSKATFVVCRRPGIPKDARVTQEGEDWVVPIPPNLVVTIRPKPPWAFYPGTGFYMERSVKDQIRLLEGSRGRA